MYLESADYPVFGVPNATSQQVQAASEIIDAFVQWPVGMLNDGTNMVKTGAQIVELRAVPFSGLFVPGYRPIVSVTQIRTKDRGFPISWKILDTTQWALDANRIWISDISPGDAEITYLAGWLYTALPSSIKQACANIITTMANVPELNGNIQTVKAGDTQVTRFKDTVLDADTKAMLSPYRRDFA